MKTLASATAIPRGGWQFARRLAGRIRHGLLMQEILDRLADVGIVIYPYFISIVQCTRASDPELAADPRYAMRLLSAADEAAMLRIAPRDLTTSTFLTRLAQARCLGLFDGAELIGYGWVKFDTAPIPRSASTPLIELRPHEAYLFDIFVAASHRGRRLADVILGARLRHLERNGRTCGYVYTLAFNRSPRRQWARLGIEDLELRVFLRPVRWLSGLDVRLWRREPRLRTPWLKRVTAREVRHGG
jgi:hypothetical protein